MPQQHYGWKYIYDQLNPLPNDQLTVRNNLTFEAIRDFLNKN